MTATNSPQPGARDLARIYDAVHYPLGEVPRANVMLSAELHRGGIANRAAELTASWVGHDHGAASVGDALKSFQVIDSRMGGDRRWKGSRLTSPLGGRPTIGSSASLAFASATGFGPPLY